MYFPLGDSLRLFVVSVRNAMFVCSVRNAVFVFSVRNAMFVFSVRNAMFVVSSYSLYHDMLIQPRDRSLSF